VCVVCVCLCVVLNDIVSEQEPHDDDYEMKSLLPACLPT
jgi:hypothetical protein